LTSKIAVASSNRLLAGDASNRPSFVVIEMNRGPYSRLAAGTTLPPGGNAHSWTP